MPRPGPLRGSPVQVVVESNRRGQFGAGRVLGRARGRREDQASFASRGEPSGSEGEIRTVGDRDQAERCGPRRKDSLYAGVARLRAPILRARLQPRAQNPWWHHRCPERALDVRIRRNRMRRSRGKRPSGISRARGPGIG